MIVHELTVLCTKLSNNVESLETELKQTKQTYGDDFTKLIKKVKKLEQTIKTSQARRRAKIVVSDDEDNEEDPSKQERSMIEEIDQDAGITFVQINAEDQGSATKVLADAARKRREVVNVYSYTRRRKAVSTGSGGISTASGLFSTVEESVSTISASMPVSTAGMVQEVSIPSPVATKDKGKAIMQESEQPKKIKKRVQIQMSLDEELAQKLHEEEQARFNDDVQAQIQADEDLAQKLIQDGTLQGKNFYEVKEMFDKTYKQVTLFVPMDSVMEKERTKRAGLNLQEESSK
ncbi:hypothetical protein Tco_1558768, partial [Tanacetum coccineum]